MNGGLGRCSQSQVHALGSSNRHGTAAVNADVRPIYWTWHGRSQEPVGREASAVMGRLQSGRCTPSTMIRADGHNEMSHSAITYLAAENCHFTVDMGQVSDQDSASCPF